MISLSLSLSTFSVYLSICLSTYLSDYQFCLSICPSLFCCSVNINSSHRSNFDTTITSVVSSLHLSLCLSFLFVLCLFPILLSISFSPLASLTLSLLLFFPSLPTSFLRFALKLWLYLKRWSFYSSQCSSRFNFYSTIVLSLIKIPTKKSKTSTEKKNNTYPDALFNFLLNNRLDLIGILSVSSRHVSFTTIR